MCKQHSLYPFKVSLALVKVGKRSMKWIQLKLNETSVEKFENESWLRCAWTNKIVSLILNFIK